MRLSTSFRTKILMKKAGSPPNHQDWFKYFAAAPQHRAGRADITAATHDRNTTVQQADDPNNTTIALRKNIFLSKHNPAPPFNSISL